MEVGLCICNVAAMACLYVCMYVGVHAYVKDFVALVQVVQLAHGLGIFHRDISISNIFYDKQSNHIFLNDWSSAYYKHSSPTSSSLFRGNSVKWVGTPYFSCSSADDRGNHIPTAADDLRSIVKCAQISYCNPPFFSTSSANEMEVYFDREILQSPYWRKAWNLAGNCEYDSLAAHFQQI